MRIVVGVTDSRWATFLRDDPSISEANFWQPSPHGFKALTEGEPFLFKTKHPRTYPGLDMPGYALVGGGFFEEYLEMPVSEAWAIWGRANGVGSEQELLNRVQGYRDSKHHEPQPDPTIGCVILRNTFFADPGGELPQPPNWSPNNVTIEGYEMLGRGRKTDSPYVQEAFQLLQSRARVDLRWDTDLKGVEINWDGPKFGSPVLTRPRMGQGRFRRAVDEAYSYGVTSASMPIYAFASAPNCAPTVGTASSSTNARPPDFGSRCPHRHDSSPIAMPSNGTYGRSSVAPDRHASQRPRGQPASAWSVRTEQYVSFDRPGATHLNQ